MNLSVLSEQSEFYNKKSPLQCNLLIYIGMYLLLLLISSIFSNSFLIYKFVKNNSLLSPINYMIFLLAIFNLIGSLFQLPITITNAFRCRLVLKINLIRFFFFLIFLLFKDSAWVNMVVTLWHSLYISLAS